MQVTTILAIVLTVGIICAIYGLALYMLGVIWKAWGDE
jgi:hypothetical protein